MGVNPSSLILPKFARPSNHPENVTKWSTSCVQVVTKWLPSGLLVVTKWSPSGHQVVTKSNNSFPKTVILHTLGGWGADTNSIPMDDVSVFLRNVPNMRVFY